LDAGLRGIRALLVGVCARGAQQRSQCARSQHTVAAGPQRQHEQFRRLPLLGDQQDLSACGIDRDCFAVARAIRPAEHDRPGRFERRRFRSSRQIQLPGLGNHMQLHSAAQAAVVASVGDQQVGAAIEFECSQVFPVGRGRVRDFEGRTLATAPADRMQPRRVAAVLDQPQHIVVTARRGQPADFVELGVQQQPGQPRWRRLGRGATGHEQTSQHPQPA